LLSSEVSSFPKSSDYRRLAKVAPEDIPAWQKLDLTGRRILMRSVLAATLKLKVSLYNMLQPVYLLAVEMRAFG
jgi:hypothetical protein